MAGRLWETRLRGRVGTSCLLVLLLVVQGLALTGVPPAGAAGEVLFGANPGGANDGRLGELNDLETSINRPLDFVRVFEVWDSPFPTAYHDTLVSSNHQMLLSVRPKKLDGSFIAWRDIADAQPGTSIHDELVVWIERVRAIGDPVWFTFNHEPEVVENIANGTDQDFIDAWRRVVDEFRTRNVTNVEFVWIMTDYSFAVPSTDRRHAPKWYPGDDVVDYMAADAYNWSGCRPNEQNPWRTMTDIIEPFRQFGLSHPDKGLMLAEWASTETAGDNGAAKAAWIGDVSQLLQQPGWEQFMAIAYFNQPDPRYPACAWNVDSTQAALDAFRVMANHPYYGGATAGSGGVVFVVASPAALDAGEAAVLSRFQSLGADVTVLDDDAATSGSAIGTDLVVISSSVSATLASTFKGVATPVWVSKPWILDDMGMAGASPGVDYGSTSASQITITDAGHPLAAALSGVVTVTSAARLTQFGVPSGEVTTVATVAGKPTIFTYGAGDQLTDGTSAAGCRVAFSIYQNAPALFTADGWALFDAAASYAINGCSISPPNDAPVVAITEPADGQTVTGVVSVVTTASDDDGISQVEFFAAGATVGVDTDGTDGWSMSWDSSTSPAGPVDLSAVATDSLGATGTDTVTITVDHGAPTVSLSGPVGGSLVSGVVPVSAVASDDDGVVGVEFFVGGVSLGVDADGSDGWGVSWDSAAGSDGGVTVSAVATDSGGNTASDSVSVTVDNEGPSVSVSAPIDGATVSGVVAVAASASDTVGVAQVEFFADGVSLGVDADGSDGWGVSWNTNASPAGVVSLSATATDLSGATDSDTISVTIDTSGGGVVVLVVGNPAALSSGDVAVVARFEALGSVVTLVDDNDATAGSATGADVVVVSSTANSNLLKTAFKSVAIPVWVSKPYLLDDMGMTGTSAGTDYGTVSASQVTITDPAHPLAAGLSGTVTITPAARLMQFGVPGGDGVTVATVAGTPTTFLYEAGQQLADGTTAAGCRVAFSIFQTAPASFTTDAWALFDAAATYTLNGCVPVVSNDPPTVTITGPADGATVSGTTSVSADAADTDGVSKVEFFADGASLGVDTDAGDGWSIDWDTTTSPAGPVSLSATATDTLGATGTDTIAVTVDHGAPTVTVTAPADGSTVSGATTVSADAADPDGVTQVEFFVDGTSIGVDTDAGDGWSVSWDTTATGDGVAVSVTAAATDTLGAQGSNGVTVTVDNDGPTVTITAPADGSTVIGATAVSADASDTVGISQVEFFVDGTPIGVDTTSGDGWTVSWDTTTSGDGPVAVSATATDTGGRTATDAITVTVDNTTNGLVVIVVGNPAALSTGDTAIVTRLEASGYLVTALDDDGLTTTSADGANLVIISSTSNSNKIGTVFNGLTQTVWDAKTWHFDDLGLTGTGANSDYGNTATETITITNPTHPLAAGLTGTIGFTTIRRTVSWGQPGPDADIIATANTNPTIFIYQTGDTLANGTTTPGCRITFPIFGDGPTYYTTQAWTLFDATTTHATNGCPTG